jgi:hypothetical protein
MGGNVIQSGPMALNLAQSPGCTQLEYLLEEKFAVSVSALFQKNFTENYLHVFVTIIIINMVSSD